MHLSDAPLDQATWHERLASSALPANLDAFSQHVQNYPAATAGVLVDCTATDAVPSLYESWMRQGLHVITPNKRLGAGPLARYKAVQELRRSQLVHFFAEVRSPGMLSTTRCRLDDDQEP